MLRQAGKLITPRAKPVPAMDGLSGPPRQGDEFLAEAEGSSWPLPNGESGEVRVAQSSLLPSPRQGMRQPRLPRRAPVRARSLSQINNF